MKYVNAFFSKKVFGLLIFLGSATLVLAEDPFAPGAGGNLPSFTEFQPVEGMVGGFLVHSSVRHNNSFYEGTHAEVDMSFPDAATLGVDLITLQYQKTDLSWANFLYDNKEVTTTGTNFSLTLDAPYTFRLLLTGGAKNGYVSNTQTASISSVNTYFSQVTMDESMNITGVMVPWLGRGLQAGFTVKKNSDNSVVEGGLTYQWYRVNPVTFQETAIPGADSLTYITKVADLGYRLMAVATGNQTTVGGFYKMMAGSSTVSPNKSYVTNPSTSGFGLILYYDVPSIGVNDLVLRDKDWTEVAITSVQKGAANGVFRINASLSLDKSPYSLQNKSNFWRICTEMVFGPMSHTMEGVNIDLNASNLVTSSEESTLNVLYDASAKQIRFTSASNVLSASLYNLAGTQVGSWEINQLDGSLSATALQPGVYLLRFHRQEGSITRKVLITK